MFFSIWKKTKGKKDKMKEGCLMRPGSETAECIIAARFARLDRGYEKHNLCG